MLNNKLFLITSASLSALGTIYLFNKYQKNQQRAIMLTVNENNINHCKDKNNIKQQIKSNNEDNIFENNTCIYNLEINNEISLAKLIPQSLNNTYSYQNKLYCKYTEQEYKSSYYCIDCNQQKEPLFQDNEWNYYTLPIICEYCYNQHHINHKVIKIDHTLEQKLIIKKLCINQTEISQFHQSRQVKLQQQDKSKAEIEKLLPKLVKDIINQEINQHFDLFFENLFKLKFNDNFIIKDSFISLAKQIFQRIMELSDNNYLLKSYIVHKLISLDVFSKICENANLINFQIFQKFNYLIYFLIQDSRILRQELIRILLQNIINVISSKYLTGLLISLLQFNKNDFNQLINNEHFAKASEELFGYIKENLQQQDFNDTHKTKKYYIRIFIVLNQLYQSNNGAFLEEQILNNQNQIIQNIIEVAYLLQMPLLQINNLVLQKLITQTQIGFNMLALKEIEVAFRITINLIFQTINYINIEENEKRCFYIELSRKYIKYLRLFCLKNYIQQKHKQAVYQENTEQQQCQEINKLFISQSLSYLIIPISINLLKNMQINRESIDKLISGIFSEKNEFYLLLAASFQYNFFSTKIGQMVLNLHKIDKIWIVQEIRRACIKVYGIYRRPYFGDYDCQAYLMQLFDVSDNQLLNSNKFINDCEEYYRTASQILSDKSSLNYFQSSQFQDKLIIQQQIINYFQIFQGKLTQENIQTVFSKYVYYTDQKQILEQISDFDEVELSYTLKCQYNNEFFPFLLNRDKRMLDLLLAKMSSQLIESNNNDPIFGSEMIDNKNSLKIFDKSILKGKAFRDFIFEQLQKLQVLDNEIFKNIALILAMFAKLLNIDKFDDMQFQQQSDLIQKIIGFLNNQQNNENICEKYKLGTLKFLHDEYSSFIPQD